MIEFDDDNNLIDNNELENVDEDEDETGAAGICRQIESRENLNLETCRSGHQNHEDYA